MISNHGNNDPNHVPRVRGFVPGGTDGAVVFIIGVLSSFFVYFVQGDVTGLICMIILFCCIPVHRRWGDKE